MKLDRKFKINFVSTASDIDCQIQEAYGIKLNNWKIIPAIFLHLITGGLALIAQYWSV